MSFTLSPIHSLSCGYGLMCIIIITFYLLGFYDDSQYFGWGPPIEFFYHIIETKTAFYILLFLIFTHQLVTNWIYEVVYPWVINTVQNPRNTTLNYNKPTCLMIVNLNSLYSQIHLAFIISGMTSQISFLVALICADFITLSYINWHYIRDKTVDYGNSSANATEMDEKV
jgi:hypothetical protein